MKLYMLPIKCCDQDGCDTRPSWEIFNEKDEAQARACRTHALKVIERLQAAAKPQPLGA